MGVGATGLLSHLVLNPAEEETRLGFESVTVHLLQGEGRHAPECQRRLRLVTHKNVSVRI